MFEQFHVHYIVTHHLSTPSDDCCGHTFNWCRIFFFFSLRDFTSIFSNFWIIFPDPQQSITFFHTLQSLEFLQRYWYIVIVLLKNLFQQSTILHSENHGKLVTRLIKKCCLLIVCIKTAMNRVHDKYFHLHILMLTTPSGAKSWNYFFLCYAHSIVHYYSVEVWRHSYHSSAPF